ncbi:hypothetical protein Nepgr_000885 [Nepenthes gracilis]|uniref:DDT domain-containing protein DDR4 n=1 Tax=Nepenthes gracilis TaxID=150966 RepID=A0AAD3RWW3_NEPGR|nr:hypothetical protein Nepgr_000885 [Nepenthes gracilis]
MTENGRQRTTPHCRNLGEEVVTAAVENGGAPDSSSSSELELWRLKLRQRWELASVLNFLNVFETVIGRDLKLSAEDIETALMKPDASLAKLHVTLLKGIPPVSKDLSHSDQWVTFLCKKLAMWWPLVAEGKIPLIAASGEEIQRYKELDPTTRLLMLKALCEIRASQGDSVTFINDSVKQGTQASSFRKDKIGSDANGISYWYDGNSVIGHRLYREVNESELQPKHRGQTCLDPPFSMKWDTIATNLDEFRKVLAELSSSHKEADVAICRTIATDAIPVLEKLQKKKDRMLKRHQKEHSILNGYHSCRVVTTRSCRARRHVSYTFEEYDRMVNEALQLTEGGKITNEQRHGKRRVIMHEEQDNAASDPSSKGSIAAVEDVAGSDKLFEGNDDTDHTDSHAGKYNIAKDGNSNAGDFTYGKKNIGRRKDAKLISGVKPRYYAAVGTRNLGMKNRLRQRPTRNTAIEISVVPDSDDQSSPDSMGD